MLTSSATTTDLVGYLYRRAGFGAPTDLATTSASGYEAAVRTLVSGLGGPDAAGDGVPSPTLSSAASIYEQKRALRRTGSAARMSLKAQLHQEFVDLTSWWLGRMIVTSTPLKEKLTFLLHGQFPTAISKVKYPAYMYGQNQLFRTQGSGDFTTLTQAVATDPAMLIWLDADSNKASDPNENFARELMERFTMGIGSYTQDDVLAASFCFTGWSVDRRTGMFAFDAADHADRPQRFLAKTGVSSGSQVIDIVTQSAASSRFVPARFWSVLAYPVTPHHPVIDDLAPGYAADRNLANLLSAIFLHPEFTSSKAIGGLVKQPTEYVVGALRALGIGPADLQARPTAVIGAMAGMGQVLFDPPSVGGWPQNSYWLSTAAALARWEFAHRLARRGDISTVADASGSDRVEAAAELLAVSRWSSQTASVLRRAAVDPPTLVTLALVSPEYVTN
jgi:uncharacterized protein (DUF1800 family)